jgi:hypothetical protein
MSGAVARREHAGRGAGRLPVAERSKMRIRRSASDTSP